MINAFSRRRRIAGALAAVGASLALVAALAPQPATASPKAPAPSTKAQSAASALARDYGLSASTAAARLKQQQAFSARAVSLGKKLSSKASAGSWIDQKRGRLMVAVTTDAAAAEVRAAGATSVKVRWSGAQLATVQKTLDVWSTKHDAGLVKSWGVDVTTNSVRIEVGAGSSKGTTAFLAMAHRFGSRVTVAKTTGTLMLQREMLGGQQIEFGDYICSAGFGARSSTGAARMITAGHCGVGYPTYRSGGIVLGKALRYSFPGSDYTVASLTSDWTPTNKIKKGSGYVTVTGSKAAAVGSTVCKSGRTTGWTCGTVKALNQTVRYSSEDGSGTQTVYGLTKNTTCTQPGDSGGANVTGHQAQGMVSGGTGYGPTGLCGEKVGLTNESYFQPVNEPLQRFGLKLVTS